MHRENVQVYTSTVEPSLCGDKSCIYPVLNLLQLLYKLGESIITQIMQRHWKDLVREIIFGKSKFLVYSLIICSVLITAWHWQIWHFIPFFLGCSSPGWSTPRAAVLHCVRVMPTQGRRFCPAHHHRWEAQQGAPLSQSWEDAVCSTKAACWSYAHAYCNEVTSRHLGSLQRSALEKWGR